jgi:hypothetical protein
MTKTPAIAGWKSSKVPMAKTDEGLSAKIQVPCTT